PKLIEDFIDFKYDCISHAIPGGSDFPNPVIYRTGCGCLYIYQLLNSLQYFKDELKKLEHKSLTSKGAEGGRYSLECVINGENRFPHVFKDAYSCELFLFVLSDYLTVSEMVFSYYHEIFKNDNCFR